MTKALIRLRVCAGWSAPLLLANLRRQGFSRRGPYIRGGSICNENPFITPSTNALGSYAICQIKDQSVAVKMVHETLC